VNIARTLANDPQVLLLDEPTSALDERASGQVLALLGELRERLGLTMIMVTHSKEQAREIADHVVMLREGRLEAQGGGELLEP
jgi:ABC-type methionine transport system ATPase subunit